MKVEIELVETEWEILDDLIYHEVKRLEKEIDELFTKVGSYMYSEGYKNSLNNEIEMKDEYLQSVYGLERIVQGISFEGVLDESEKSSGIAPVV